MKKKNKNMNYFIAKLLLQQRKMKKREKVTNRGRLKQQ